MKQPKHAVLYLVEVEDGYRPLVAVGIRRGTSARLRILERDPVFYRCSFKTTELHSIKRCEDTDSAEMTALWGVTAFEDDPKRCPECGTLNSIRRLDTGCCLSCVMRMWPPIELPKPLKATAKKKSKRGRRNKLVQKAA